MDRKANPIIAKPPKYSKRLRFQLDLSIYNLQWGFLVPGNSKFLTNKFLEEPGTFGFNQELLGLTKNFLVKPGRRPYFTGLPR